MAAEPAPPDHDWLNLQTATVMLGIVGGTLAYGKSQWWQDGFTGDFKSSSEGWFGQNTNYGGADKLGHAMGAYAGTRLPTRWWTSAVYRDNTTPSRTQRFTEAFFEYVQIPAVTASTDRVLH